MSQFYQIPGILLDIEKIQLIARDSDYLIVKMADSETIRIRLTGMAMEHHLTKIASILGAKTYENWTHGPEELSGLPFVYGVSLHMVAPMNLGELPIFVQPGKFYVMDPPTTEAGTRVCLRPNAWSREGSEIIVKESPEEIELQVSQHKGQLVSFARSETDNQSAPN
jgi:hypothetical protein